ncbi:GMP reductase [bacterium]|nr:GMP reductase [bacterium]
MHAYHYKDITLVPKYSTLDSRSLADTTTKLGAHTFKTPIVPSNMKCTIDNDAARVLSTNGYFYIMHRFDNVTLGHIKIANEEQWPIISVSAGVGEGDKVLFDEIFDKGYRVDYITVDIAHGHHIKMKQMLEYLQKFRALRNTQIIAGNITTCEAAYDLIKWGADIVKVGIGQGYVCTTKDKTGFTMPMFTCVNKMPVHIPVIADGGIRSNGDIAKAIVAGASMVMAGSMFAKLADSPSATFKDLHTGETLKEYYGSASFYNKGYNKNIEGKRELIEADTLTYLQKMQEIREDLQSAISYAGGFNLDSLRNVSYYTQSI